MTTLLPMIPVCLYFIPFSSWYVYIHVRSVTRTRPVASESAAFDDVVPSPIANASAFTLALARPAHSPPLSTLNLLVSRQIRRPTSASDGQPASAGQRHISPKP
jgi:hypothetical protein